MKTTVEIADPLLDEAKALARQEGLTLRELIDRGLRLALAESRRPPYRLPDLSFDGGTGLHPDAVGRPFAEILDWSYGSKRGGSDPPAGVDE